MWERIKFRDAFAVLLAGAFIFLLTKGVAVETVLVLLTLVVQFYFRRKET